MEKIRNSLEAMSFYTPRSKILSYQERRSTLEKLYQVIDMNSELIHQALKKDLGKSKFEAYIGEIDFVLNDIRHSLKNLKKWMRPKRVWTSLTLFPVRSYIYHEPLGKILIIGPWNYPFQLILTPLVGALAAGNTAVLKPSEVSEHTSVMLQKIISENFDPSVISIIEGGVEETTFLLEQNFDHIFFTGNAVVARMIMEKAAKNLTPVTLELGGKSPCLIFTEKLDLAAKRVVWGKFFNCGQTCVAPDYILISKEDKDTFVKYCDKWIRHFYGQNIKENEDYGRIINHRHFDRLNGYLGEDVQVLIGGECVRESNYIAQQ